MDKHISISLLSALALALVAPAHAAGPSSQIAQRRVANSKQRLRELAAPQELASSAQVGAMVHAGVGVGLFAGLQRASVRGRERVSLVFSPRAYRGKGVQAMVGLEMDDRLQPTAAAPRHEVRQIGGLAFGVGGLEATRKESKASGAAGVIAGAGLGFTASGKEHRATFAIPLFSRRSPGIRYLDRSDAALDRAERMLEKDKPAAAARALAKAERLSAKAAGQDYQRQHAPEVDVGAEH